MNTIVIKDIEEADVRKLSAEEMENIRGGEGPDIGGWSMLGEVVGSILAPVDMGELVKKYKEQQKPKRA